MIFSPCHSASYLSKRTRSIFKNDFFHLVIQPVICRSEQGGSEGDASDKTRTVLAAQPLSVRNRAKYVGHHGATAAARHYSRDKSKVETQFLVYGRWFFRLS